MYYSISLTFFCTYFARSTTLFCTLSTVPSTFFLHLGGKKENVLMCKIQYLINTLTHSRIHTFTRLLVFISGGDTGAFALNLVEYNFADAQG